MTIQTANLPKPAPTKSVVARVRLKPLAMALMLVVAATSEAAAQSVQQCRILQNEMQQQTADVASLLIRYLGTSAVLAACGGLAANQEGGGEQEVTTFGVCAVGMCWLVAGFENCTAVVKELLALTERRSEIKQEISASGCRS